MKTQEELIRSRGYWIASIQLDLFKQVDDYMKKNKLNRSQLAEKLGVTKGYVSQILNGDFNHRIATFVDLSLAIGKAPKIEFEDLNEMINNAREGYEVKKWKVVVRRNPQIQTIEPTGKTEIENKTIIKGDWCKAVNAF